MFRTVFLNSSLIAIIALMASCDQKPAEQQLPYYNKPDFTPLFFAGKREALQKVTHQVAPFTFTDQWGKPFTNKDVEGKIHVANFIFTRCGSICPVMTKHMKLVEDAFRNDAGVVLVSYTVTPWIDSVKRLRAYADNNAITSANWHFLTGSQSEIYKLARQSYFAEEDLGYTRDSTTFLHTEHILLVDDTRRIRGIYNGTLQLEIEQLIRDIRTLKKAGNEK